MTTPASPNQIGLTDVQTEFGGSNPIEIAEYYAGGSYVPATVSGVPTSGTISLNDLRGKTKIIYAISLSISPSSGIYPYTSTITWTSNLPVGGYVNIIITYPNGSINNILTNQAINGTAQASWGATIGTGTGSVYATGYNSSATLLATSNTATYSIYAPAAINSVYFSPSSITAGVTPFALYWSVSNASRIDYIITLPSGGRITDTVTNLNSNSGQFITYTAGTLTGEIIAYGINGGSVSTLISVSVAAQPTYTLTRSASSVNEGDSFTITFATNQPGYFSYTISGVSSSDINSAALTGYVTNGSVLSYYVTPDQLTEGTEYFTISLDNGQASTTVTINDTSVAVVYPSISGLTTSTYNAYPDSAITVSWNTTNAVTSSTILQIFTPAGGVLQFSNMSANSRYFGSYSFTDIGLYTVNVYVYSVTGQSASASTNFYVRAIEVIPTVNASVSPSSAYNTDGVTISWSTTNTSYVAITINYPGGSSSSSSGYAASGTYPIGGSSSLPIGSYSATITAYSSTGNTATTTVYWTFTAAASFSATYTGYLSFPSNQTAGPYIYFDETNRRISIYPQGLNNIAYYGLAYYTTTAPGYLYCFLELGTELYYDFAYFYVNGTAVYAPSVPSGFYHNGSGGYSGGPGQVFNNVKVGPIAAGNHNILIYYTKDGSVSSNGDYVSGAWTWSAT